MPFFIKYKIIQAAILNQVRDAEFKKQIIAREKQFQKEKELSLVLSQAEIEKLKSLL